MAWHGWSKQERKGNCTVEIKSVPQVRLVGRQVAGNHAVMVKLCHGHEHRIRKRCFLLGHNAVRQQMTTGFQTSSRKAKTPIQSCMPGLKTTARSGSYLQAAKNAVSTLTQHTNLAAPKCSNLVKCQAISFLPIELGITEMLCASHNLKSSVLSTSYINLF